MSHSTKCPINYLKMVSIMFIAFFVTMIITCIIVFAIIYFPYKKVADFLGNFIHLRTMFAGVFLLLPVSLLYQFQIQPQMIWLFSYPIPE